MSALSSSREPDPLPQPRADDERELAQALLTRELDAEARRGVGERVPFVHRLLRGLGRRFGYPKRTEDVEDLAHNVLAIALSKIDRMRRGIPLEAWLHRICSLELSNALRQRRRQRTVPGNGVEATADDDAIRSLDDREQLFAALEQIGPADAEAVRLHHFDGLTFPEAAARVGVTVNVIKGRYYRGIAQLGTMLDAR